MEMKNKQLNTMQTFLEKDEKFDMSVISQIFFENLRDMHELNIRVTI